MYRRCYSHNAVDDWEGQSRRGNNFLREDRLMNHNGHKRIGLILLAATMILIFSFTGCGKKFGASKDAANKNKKGSSGQDALTAEFFKKHGNAFESGWKPERILNYSEAGASEFVNEDGKFTDEDLENCRLGYIQKVKDRSVQIKEMNWILDENEPNGFRVEDKGGKAVSYLLDKNCKIWFLAEAAIYYQVPYDDLERYYKDHDAESKLWCFSMEDDNITFLAEQYIP